MCIRDRSKAALTGLEFLRADFVLDFVYDPRVCFALGYRAADFRKTGKCAILCIKTTECAILCSTPKTCNFVQNKMYVKIQRFCKIYKNTW